MLTLQSMGDLLSQLPCLQLSSAPEIFGPTDINAQSGNQGLSVGLNRAGTVTVFRWPRPSFYDQLKYRTTDRDRPRFGAAPNAGAFLGLVVSADGTRETTWLRDWEHAQRYLSPESDAVRTEYRSAEFGLSVTVTDVVARDEDALVREVDVSKREDSPVREAKLVAFENFNLVVTKEPRNPVQDWCREGENTDGAEYRPDADAIVHAKAGVDESTGDRRSVATAMAFAGESHGHQVGGDAYEPAAREPRGRLRDAYDDALDGALRGNDAYSGQTTGTLSRRLDLGDGEDAATLVLAAGADQGTVLAALDRVRGREPRAIRRAKREWVEELIGDAPMPATDDEAVRELARRALVTLVTNYDPASGAIVASIATQSPYALDWPRDGAYFNYALDMLGLEEWVEKRNRWYASLQSRTGDGVDAPPGNWAMNYYGDGVVGGPIPWEIDETGYVVWTLWDHYAHTGDEEYLADVYPTIRRAADFLVSHRDPSTGLHAAAHEDDNVFRSQTIVGAGVTWLALESAAEAAGVLGEEGDARRYRRRSDELSTAIDTHLWDPEDGAYTGGSPDVDWLRGVPLLSDAVKGLPLLASDVAEPAVAWPVGFRSLSTSRMAEHLETVWEHIRVSFEEPDEGERHSGLYEAQGLVVLARAWRDDPERFDLVQEGVRWIAHHHATPDTRVMGEVWMRDGDEVVTTVSQPHTWAQLLFYFASLEAFPPPEVEPGPEGGVLESLRERAREERGRATAEAESPADGD